MKRVLLTMGLAGLVATGVFAPALADHDPENPGDPAEEACGGEYDVTVEVETIMITPSQGVGYCSDGTFQGLGVEPTGNGHSGCGGNYDVTIEADTSDAGAPVTGYCSDGTLGALGVPPTGDGQSGCGGNYDVTVEADTSDAGAPVSGYCSDGTIDGVKDLLP